MVKKCAPCRKFFAKHVCSARTHGECDCPECQGYCKCVTGMEEETVKATGPSKGNAKRLFDLLIKGYQKLPSTQCEWPGCHDVAVQIAEWFNKQGYDVRVVQGFLDGNSENYHWWVEVVIARNVWIVDGARRQFSQLTGDDSDLLMRLKKRDEREYVVEILDE